MKGIVVKGVMGMVLAFQLVSSLASAQDCINYRDFLHWVSSMDTPGRSYGVAISGIHVFVADWISGLQVLMVQCENDCNNNGILDEEEIADHPSMDFNGDGILDECQQGQGVSTVNTDHSKMISIFEAYPNPFNPQTTIAFDIPNQETVRLAVYDVSGRLVDVLIDNEIAAQGRNEVVWRGRDMAGRVVSAGV